jgi:hypothetical protein
MDNSSDFQPSKRVKLDADHIGSSLSEPPAMFQQHDDHPKEASSTHSSAVSDDAAKEREVGIIAFVNESRAVFRGTLKKRYTDFLVNEILPNGTVLHLRSMKTRNDSGQSKSEAVPSEGEEKGVPTPVPEPAKPQVEAGNGAGPEASASEANGKGVSVQEKAATGDVHAEVSFIFSSEDGPSSPFRRLPARGMPAVSCPSRSN